MKRRKQFGKERQADIMFFTQPTNSFDKMKFLVIFVLFIIKNCESHDIECDRFYNQINSFGAYESVEFYCAKSKGNLSVNCSASFSTTNIGHESKVNKLKFNGCDHNKVKQLVEMFPNLRALDISHSGIETLDLFNLKHERLEKVNASHNQLTEIPTEFFSQLSAVTEIDFSYNDLKHFNKMPNKLVKMHMSHNQFSQIDSDTFADLVDLEYLDLSYNSISSNTFYRIFAENHNLKTLRLDNNFIFEFDYNFFPLVRRASVTISWEKLLQFEIIDSLEKPIRIVVKSQNEQTNNTEGSVEGNQDEGLFQAKDGKFELHCRPMSLNQTYLFKILNNYIENPGDILRCLSPISLKFFELNGRGSADNALIPSLEHFTNLSQLTFNSMLMDFDVGTIKNLKNLVDLDISHNNLTRIKNAHHFDELQELLALSIQGNQLENSDELIQHLTSNIKTLRLDGNILSKLNATTFSRFTDLLLRIY